MIIPESKPTEKTSRNNLGKALIFLRLKSIFAKLTALSLNDFIK